MIQNQKTGMNMNPDLIAYYKERAREYERIYDKPERQDDLLQATKILQNIFTGKSLYEIACGTGYWTERIAQTAHSILATDINEAVIEIAKSKKYHPAKVDFETADIFNLASPVRYESLFGGFIWSHIPLQDIDHFLHIIHNLVEPGGTIVFMDNNYVEGSNLPVTATDDFGNTFQTRILDNGSTFSILKNFPGEAFIRRALSGKAEDIQFINLQYYWIVRYRNW